MRNSIARHETIESKKRSLSQEGKKKRKKGRGESSSYANHITSPCAIYVESEGMINFLSFSFQTKNRKRGRKTLLRSFFAFSRLPRYDSAFTRGTTTRVNRFSMPTSGPLRKYSYDALFILKPISSANAFSSPYIGNIPALLPCQ